VIFCGKVLFGGVLKMFNMVAPPVLKIKKHYFYIIDFFSRTSNDCNHNFAEIFIIFNVVMEFFNMVVPAMIFS
jgi:hypothetical protein